MNYKRCPQGIVIGPTFRVSVLLVVCIFKFNNNDFICNYCTVGGMLHLKLCGVLFFCMKVVFQKFITFFTRPIIYCLEKFFETDTNELGVGGN